MQFSRGRTKVKIFIMAFLAYIHLFASNMKPHIKKILYWVIGWVIVGCQSYQTSWQLQSGHSDNQVLPYIWILFAHIPKSWFMNDLWNKTFTFAKLFFIAQVPSCLIHSIKCLFRGTYFLKMPLYAAILISYLVLICFSPFYKVGESSWK